VFPLDDRSYTNLDASSPVDAIPEGVFTMDIRRELPAGTWPVRLCHNTAGAGQ
jgi:hypothetical protein